MSDPLDEFRSLKWSGNDYSLKRSPAVIRLSLSAMLVGDEPPQDLRLVISDPDRESLMIWDADRGTWREGDPADFPISDRFVDGAAKPAGSGFSFSFAVERPHGLIRWGLWATAFTLERSTS